MLNQWMHKLLPEELRVRETPVSTGEDFVLLSAQMQGLAVQAERQSEALQDNARRIRQVENQLLGLPAIQQKLDELLKLITGPSGDDPPERPTPAEAVEFCNQLFRMEEHLAQLKEAAADQAESNRPLRRIGTGIEKLRSVLQTLEIEYRDLGGETWRPTRKDFEALGKIREQAGVSDTLIERCEKPAVFHHGQLLQVAKGTVIGPQHTNQQ